MIVRDLRLGSKAIIRIYRNGVIIWEGGKKFTAAQLISVLAGFALVDTDYPVPIQMDADINAETVGKPFSADANASAYGKAELVGNVTPQRADTRNGMAQTKSILTAIATPLSALYVWCRGKVEMALGTHGMAQRADTRNGAGETTANITEQASPNTQGITKMLFVTKSELSTVATHEKADTLEKASLYASNNLAVCGRMGTWLEPVVVDGVLILRQAYSATVTDGILEVR